MSSQFNVNGKCVSNLWFGLGTAGEEWRKLTTAAKVPYEQRAELEKQKYGDAMKDYNKVRKH